jgi:urate oxidase
MAINAEGFSFEQRHGKARVRVGRVWKNRAGRHFFVEWNVSISLLSDCADAYLREDNSDIVATDTMKNTVCNSIVL